MAQFSTSSQPLLYDSNDDINDEGAGIAVPSVGTDIKAHILTEGKKETCARQSRTKYLCSFWLTSA
jgi:hypothetical protein